MTTATSIADADGDGALWSYHNNDQTYGNWVKVADDVGSNQNWTNQGSISATTDDLDRVYVVGVRNPNAGSGDGGELQVFRMTPRA